MQIHQLQYGLQQAVERVEKYLTILSVLQPAGSQGPGRRPMNVAGNQDLPVNGGWMPTDSPTKSQDSSIGGISLRAYSFPRHLMLDIFQVCYNERLIILPTLEINNEESMGRRHDYCLYHRSVGHIIHNCGVFNDIVKNLIS